jgi:hypothetical protein
LKSKDIQAFELLKQKIAERMQQTYPGMNPSISAWKGQEISDFQEELLQKVNAHISEKWFYSHVKSEKDTLPRIDMLNLLSKYAGYSNWDDFRFKNPGQETAVTNTLKKANRYFIYVPLLVLGILGIMFFLFKMISTKDYQFHFYDADTREPVTDNIIEVNVLKEGESPVSYLCSADGSFILKTDTIIRILDKFHRDEIVQLHPNNYAMMIQYFSTMNVKDWQRRRDQLNLMIADSAMIYQVYEESVGVELYNKWEFINKLTLPSTGLKDIEILDTQYQGDKISLIRFKQKEAEK